MKQISITPPHVLARIEPTPTHRPYEWASDWQRVILHSNRSNQPAEPGWRRYYKLPDDTAHCTIVLDNELCLECWGD